MALRLDILEEIAHSIRLPQPEVERRLRTELAVALYAQGILSFGKAADLAATSRFALAEILGERGMARHYGDDELAQDLDYARGL